MFINSLRILSAEKKNRNDSPQTQLEIQTQPSGGPYGDIWDQRRWGEYRNGQKSTTLFRHSIQTHVSGGLQHGMMIPACCVQQDRFPTCEHGIPSRPLGCYHPSGRESKTSTKRSARNSPPSLGMRDRLLRSFRFQKFVLALIWIFLSNKSIPVSLFTYPIVTRIVHGRIALRKDFSVCHPAGRFSQLSCLLDHESSIQDIPLAKNHSSIAIAWILISHNWTKLMIRRLPGLRHWYASRENRCLD